MKRILACALSLLLLLSAASCSKTPQQPEQPDVPNTQTQPEPVKPDVPPTQAASPEQPEAQELARLTVLVGSDGLSEWTEDVPLCQSSWQTLALDEESAKRYPALAQTLKEINQKNAEAGAFFMEANLDYAWEIFEENREYFYGLTDSDEYSVQRADELILSVRGDVSSYHGGVHPDYGVYGLNLNPETGERVLLSDILTTTDNLNDILEEKLREKYPGEPFVSLPEMLEEYDLEDYTWTLGYQGLTIYFSPYEIAAYASGLLTVTIWFDEAPELFREEYLQVPEDGYALALPQSHFVEFDLDSTDGVRDEISVSALLADEYGTLRPEIMLNSKQLYDEDTYMYQMEPYLVHVDGKSYLYLETTIENDYRVLNVYDLNSGEVQLVDRIYGSGFHSVWYEDEGEYGVVRTEVFTTPGHVVLDTRVEMLGTMTGTKAYHVDAANGLPVAEDDYYLLDETRPPLTTLVPVEVEILPAGEVEELPVGTQLWFLRTDDETYVDMKLADGRECRVVVESGPEGWDRYIGGVAEWDCFDGLLYAG